MLLMGNLKPQGETVFWTRELCRGYCLDAIHGENSNIQNAVFFKTKNATGPKNGKKVYLSVIF